MRQPLQKNNLAQFAHKLTLTEARTPDSPFRYFLEIIQSPGKSLKRHGHEIFDTQFFHEPASPSALMVKGIYNFF